MAGRILISPKAADHKNPWIVNLDFSIKTGNLIDRSNFYNLLPSIFHQLRVNGKAGNQNRDKKNKASFL